MKKLFVSLFVCLFVMQAKSETIIKKYELDKHVVCDGKKYAIPTYFPYNKDYSDGDLYISAECSNSFLTVYIGLTPNCTSENYCNVATFAVSSISQQVSTSIDHGFNATAKKIEFDNTKQGYYLPSICYAYCNSMNIIWLGSNKVYILGSKFSHNFDKDKIELKKSVESYLFNQNELENDN